MDTIRDAAGRVIATVIAKGDGFTEVYDGRGNPIGYSTANGTFDANARLVSLNPEQYGLLIGHED